MGTRADFYLGRGADAQWLGSVAWDGYPDGFEHINMKAATAMEFANSVAKELNSRDDSTFPERGWPWPWEDSGTTDYAYAFDGGKVWACGFGGEWFDPLDKEAEEKAGDGKAAVFPNMKDRMNVRLDHGSGLIIVGAKS